jgi:AraC-like DNA-binding protein
MVRHYLHDTCFSISEISLLLGYREVNSFYRAFKEWFGCTPQDIRGQQQDKDSP